MNKWRIVEIYNTQVMVSKEGKVKVFKGNCYVEKEWRFNNDNYPVVSIVGYDNKGEKIYRTVAVHILVAKAFVSNPDSKPEVNHKDFDRRNPNADNLEWVTHKENVEYSYSAGRYKGKFGEDNPNFGNKTLSKKYQENKELAKEKQGRKGGKNGKAKPCRLIHKDCGVIGEYAYQREAVYALTDKENIKVPKYPETIIRHLRSKGYMGYFLEIL